MKLNIYKKNEIVKTYETQEYRLKFGFMEDLAKAVKLGDTEAELTDNEILRMVTELMIQVPDLVKDFLFDIFEDLTEEDLRNAGVEDIARVFIDVILYTITKIQKSFGGQEKNFHLVRRS